MIFFLLFSDVFLQKPVVEFSEQINGYAKLYLGMQFMVGL